jgi:hypothetical protein
MGEEKWNRRLEGISGHEGRVLFAISGRHILCSPCVYSIIFDTYFFIYFLGLHSFLAIACLVKEGGEALFLCLCLYLRLFVFLFVSFAFARTFQFPSISMSIYLSTIIVFVFFGLLGV